MVWTLSAIPTSVSSWQIGHVRGTIIPQTFHTSISTTEQTREAVELFRDQQPAETTEWLQIGVSDQRGLTVVPSKVAGLETALVRIVELTDAQAIETRIVENLIRTDVHPMEELGSKCNECLLAHLFPQGHSFP